MSARVKPIDFFDFTGGRNSFDPEFLVAMNQAIDLQNINLLDKGWKKRQGNSVFNSSAMVDASTAIVGLNYMKFNSGTEFLNAVAGTKFFTSSGLTGTMADATGAVTITADKNNLWTAISYNDLQIWFGGAPNAPLKFSGSGNAAALGGSPPSAKRAFVGNNRPFAICTAANPSRIQWPILGNPEDWTGTGSGSADVAKNDGEELLQGVPLQADSAILFKNTSTHLMILTKAPFPIYQLQKGTGACGPDAIVNVNGTIYFITPSRRMKSTTDGINFQNYPSHVDDLWNRVSASRLQYTQGIYYENLYQIHWLVSLDSSTTHNASIIWDIRRQAWLYNPTGFTANKAAIAQGRRLFTGHYNGKIYEQDASGVNNDASESTSLIDAYWKTPWMPLESIDGTIHPLYLSVACIAENSSITVSYGFDFNSDRASETFDLNVANSLWDSATWDSSLWAGQTSTTKRMLVKGRGNVFSMKFRNATAGEPLTFQGASIQPRSDGARKKLTAV